MYGSGEDYLTNLRKRDDTLDIYQIRNKTKNESLMNDNQVKTLKSKNQSADYLIEYFEGIILNYISLAEEKNERLDEIKNLIYRELNKNSSQNISKLQEGGKNLYVGKKQKAKRS